MIHDDLPVKILILGDTGVGKSCFLQQFKYGGFRTCFSSTVGTDYCEKRLVRATINQYDGIEIIFYMSFFKSSTRVVKFIEIFTYKYGIRSVTIVYLFCKNHYFVTCKEFYFYLI